MSDLQTPPHSTEVEQSVLGALLMGGEALIKVADFLEPSDFYDPAHREIYQAMSRQVRGRPPV